MALSPTSGFMDTIHSWPWIQFTATYNLLEASDYKKQVESGQPWDPETTDAIARRGDLATMKYVHEHGCPWAPNTTSTLAKRGSLYTMKYVHEHGCPWSPDTLTSAAIGGYLGCLRYAHEHGCTWDNYTMLNALRNSRIDCVKYLYEHGCPFKNNSMDHVQNLDCMKYVYECGCPWTNTTWQRIFSYSPDQASMLRYMWDHGCPGAHIINPPEIKEIDITLVMDQAHCTYDEARTALTNNCGDLVNAIMELTI